MKILKPIIAVLAILALPVFIFVGVTHAQEFSTTVDEGETVDSSLFSAGRNIDINGTVNGDVFCAGQNVQINATVHGDVICAGQNVTIKGQVDGDIRAAGQNVTIDAIVERSITVAAQTVSLDIDATVGVDATVTGDSVNLKGAVGRDVLASGTSVVLSGPIDRDAEVNAAEVEVRASAHIAGALTYTSEAEAQIATGSKIVGGVTREFAEEKDTNFMAIAPAVYLYFLAAFLLIGLVAVLFFPQAVRQASSVARRRFGMTLLTGLLAGFVIPIVSFLLAITFIGLPLAILLVMLWGILMVLTVPIVGYWLANLLFKKLKNSVAVMLIGTAIVLTLCFVPYIGFIFALLVYWLGLGAMLIALKKHIPKPNYKG